MFHGNLSMAVKYLSISHSPGGYDLPCFTKSTCFKPGEVEPIPTTPAKDPTLKQCDHELCWTILNSVKYEPHCLNDTCWTCMARELATPEAHATALATAYMVASKIPIAERTEKQEQAYIDGGLLLKRISELDCGPCVECTECAKCNQNQAIPSSKRDLKKKMKQDRLERIALAEGDIKVCLVLESITQAVFILSLILFRWPCRIVRHNQGRGDFGGLSRS